MPSKPEFKPEFKPELLTSNLSDIFCVSPSSWTGSSDVFGVKKIEFQNLPNILNRKK